MVITSKTNNIVKFIKSLNEKKYRVLNTMFYLEGIKVVNEAIKLYLNGEIEIDSIVYSTEILSKTNGGNTFLEKLNEIININKYEFSKDIFNYVTDTVNTQGVLVIVKLKEKKLKDLDKLSNTVILDKIQDAGNLGNIIRTADSFFFKNVICIKGTVDCYNPKVVRSTMASILRTNIVYIDDFKELEMYLKENNYKILTTCLKANKYLNEINAKEKFAVILGNEAKGVSRESIDIADILIKIPMNNNVDSLNVASSASIMMYTLNSNFK